MAGATRAIEAVQRAGIEHAVHEYAVREPAGRERATRAAYGDDAAAALGVDPRRIHKTLVAAVDGQLVVAIVPVAGELDLKALADAVGGRRASMADVAEAERATGYVRGGISPLGQRRSLPTVVDGGAIGWPTIYVSAGRRGLQLEIAPADLVRLTGARVVPIAKGGGGASHDAGDA
jgi:Cys-tRNA(Pro)/Cys-tRNA(Cys) deacylase